MTQATTWGVPRSGASIPMTTYATRADESFDALLSMHKGSSAPSYAVAGTEWLDDTDDPIWLVKIYDGSDWSVSQIIDTTNNRVRSTDVITGTAGGTANAATLTSVIGLTAYFDGMKMRIRWPADNTSTTVTINVDAIGAKSVRQWDNSVPRVGQLQEGAWVELVYDGTDGTAKIVGGASWILVTDSMAEQDKDAVDIGGGEIDGVAIGANAPVTLVASTADINGGTIDGSVIGGSTPAAGTFAALTATGQLTASNGLDVAGSNIDLTGGHALNINSPTLNNGLLNVRGTDAGNPVQVMHATHASFADIVTKWHVDRAATSAYSFWRAYSSGSSDLEAHLNGAGTLTVDGSVSGGGADYAEMFENLKRGILEPGTTLVLDGSRVRPAKPGEELQVVGVVSAAPTAIGGNPLKWPGRRDAFGRYVANDDFDPDRAYTARRDRPSEWTVVGLLGRLGVVDGMPVNPFWVRLGPLAPGITEYLIFPAVTLGDALAGLIRRELDGLLTERTAA